MFDKVKLIKITTIIVVTLILLISSIVIGINILSIQMLPIVMIGVALLIGLQVLLLKLKIQNKNSIIKILMWVVAFLIVLAIINFIIEFTTGSVFIYRKTIPGLILFIYVSSTLVLSFLLIDRYIKQKYWFISLQSIVILLVIVFGIYDVLLIFLGGASLTEVDFEEPKVTLFLVEESLIFSSNHFLYQKTNLFYGTYLEHDGSWSCHDGCVTSMPEAYTWTWVDESTLIVSYGSTFEDVTFHLPE